MADKERRLTRLTSGQRLGLQILSLALILVGGLLFFSFLFALIGLGSSGSSMGEEGWFEDQTARIGMAFLRGALGIVILGVGAMLARLAFLKPVSELVATESAGAVEHASGAVGRGLASSGIGGGGPREVVKVRCRGCGYLDTDDARFCSSCGKEL